MYCKKCGTENDKDALFCKRCGSNLIEEYNQKSKEKEEKKKQNHRVNKVKVKKKVKKVKKRPLKSRRKRREKSERKMGLFSKVMMFFLVLLVMVLGSVCLILGYKVYSDENIEVPDLRNITYEEAKSTLLNKSLNIKRKEKIVEEEELVGTVLSQSKKPGKKVSKNTVIEVEVGTFDDFVVVPNVVGMNLDKAKNTLKHLEILVSISYEEVSSGDSDIVLNQTPQKGKKIKRNETVELKVSKKEKSIPNTKEDIDKEEIEEDIDTNTSE